MTTITLIKGDGIGPSIMDAAVDIINASGAQLDWEEAPAGLGAFEEHGDPLPAATIESIRKNGLCFKGPLTTPVGQGFRSINVALRQEFDLYANIRPATSWKGVQSRYDDVDVVTVRENTEGLYMGLENYMARDKSIAQSLAVITKNGSDRINEYAFKYAEDNNRKKVTVVHKANILKYSQGIFLDSAREVAKRHPDIEFEEKIVDAVCMHLVMDPSQLDVVVTTNMFGDILSDLTAGLVGGLGMIAGANIGDGVALFEAVHGSAPDIAGKGIANPIAVTKAGIMLLNHIGEKDAANRIETAMKKVVAESVHVTPDLNPQSGCGTEGMRDAIISAMQ